MEKQVENSQQREQGSSVSLPNLLCEETESILGDDDDDDDDGRNDHKDETFLIAFGISDGGLSDDEHIRMLFEREISYGLSKQQQQSVFPVVGNNWLKFGRSEAVSWILKSIEVFGFHLQTAYVSMHYLDRFISMREIKSDKIWVIRLVSVACLSLAAKMEESKVPCLSEFKVEEYSFESRVIQKMELLVLNTLEWRMKILTPLPFLHYFITNSSKEESARVSIFSRANQLILDVMREVSFIEYRPSTIAVAATLVALDQSLSIQEMECKINAFSPCGFLEIDDVYSCYDQIQKLAISKITMQNSVVSPELSPSHPSREDRIRNNSIVSTKRKRLVLDDRVEDHPEKRQ